MDNDDKIVKRLQTGDTCILLLGYALSVMHEMIDRIPIGGFSGQLQRDYFWLQKSVENVLYLDKPLPPLPERDKT